MPDSLITIAFLVAAIVAGLFVLYLLFVLGLLASLGTYAGISNLFSELRVKRRMRLSGRLLPWPAALKRIEESRGTLILESPTIGWAVYRSWWTPDDVLAQTPTPLPDASERDPQVLSLHPFIEWCHEHYTDLDGGTACLIAVYNGKRSANELAARFPELKRIDLWTGALALRDSPV